ncbi:MAG: hypothetical protein ABI614_24375 [Planctomycetota bacterium]
MNNGERNDDAPVKFGTFGGVFTPCVLTILGVIMFLRFSFVVGQAGLLDAVLIVAAAIVSFLVGSSQAFDVTTLRANMLPDFCQATMNAS